MFDLNYYNEITDFAATCEYILDECRVEGNKNRPWRSATERKVSKTAKKEEIMNKLMAFHSKHGKTYYMWYINYYKEPRMITQHMSLTNKEVVFKKLIKPHHV